MPYKRISGFVDLPKEGSNVLEDLHLDMKMQIPEDIDDTSQLACDVAAFANTSGGVILVGAHEHPKDSGILNKYLTISYKKAVAISDILHRALVLCSPRPIAHAKPVEFVSAEYVVAINCEPYAAPPIGVAQSGQKGGEKWWAFPARRGRSNYNLRPEELATVMEPRLRRNILALQRIPPSKDQFNSPRALFVFHSQTERTFDILELLTELSSMALIDRTDGREAIIPLDAISMIWFDTVRRMCKVGIRGEVSHSSDGSRYDFFPRY